MNNLAIKPYNTNCNNVKNRPNFTANIPEAHSAFASKLTEALKNLYKRAEREVCEYGEFKPVQIVFKNMDKSLYVGNVILKIQKATDLTNPTHMTRRYFDISVYNPTNKSHLSSILRKGTKKEILKELQDGKLHNEVENFVEASSLRLMDV